MSALVNNLLDMARIQSGEVKLRRQWLPFEEVVGSALKSAQSALVRHRVEVELGRDLPLVELDATLIERVLYNILENAGKYTPDGTIVRLAAEVAGADLLVCDQRQRTRHSQGPGRGDLREIRPGRARIGDPRRRARARDQSRDRRSPSRKDLGREQSDRRRPLLLHAAAGHSPRRAARGESRASECA